MGSIVNGIHASSIQIPIKNKALFDSRGLIAGTWRNAEFNKTFPVYEPSSGELLGHCSDFSQKDFVEAIESANKGYEQFSFSTTAKERAAILKRWYELIMENVEDCK